MENRTLEINILSAKDLNKVNIFSKMDVYVFVSIFGAGDKAKQKQKTPVAHGGDTNPSWNFPMKFTVDEYAARRTGLTLVLKLRSKRALGDRDIGEVAVSIKELIDNPAAAVGKQQFVSYQVRKPNGKPKGQLTFSYIFGDKIAGSTTASKPDRPETAYPAAAPSTAYPMVAGSSSVYPPQAPVTAYPVAAGGGVYPPPRDGAYPAPKDGYGYPYAAPPPYGGYPPGPPPPGYGGYPPQQPYGGYVQQPAKPPKKNKFGMGMGAGLLGGALGGLILGDMVSDGFDGGFDCDF